MTTCIICHLGIIERVDFSQECPNGHRSGKKEDQVHVIFDFWKQTFNHPNAKFTPDRKDKIKTRLKEGYTIEQCKQAIFGCKTSAYHMGDNHNGKNGTGIIYDSFAGLIFRKGDKMEQFIGYYEQAHKEQSKEQIA